MTTPYQWRKCRRSATRAIRALLALVVALTGLSPVSAQQPGPANEGLIFKVDQANHRIEMVVNTSRLLTLPTKITKVVSVNTQVAELMPLSPNQVQVVARAEGVTQVNMWDDKGDIHTIDVIVFPDTRHLQVLLQTQFPTAALKVTPCREGVIISGQVDDVNQISIIIKIAKQYYPEVINNMTIAGVQQVVLKVKVMEVARNRLRNLGIDFNYFTGSSFMQTGVTGILGWTADRFAQPGPVPGTQGALPPQIVTTPSDAIQLSGGIINPGSGFFGFMEALQREHLATIMAEPNLVTYSGRPARFNSGGEFPILVPQSLGTVSVQYKPYGTEVDFVPIVLGNGAIRLEVKPRISEIDPARSVIVGGINVPALRVREANAGVEMRPGQTLALAGLVQMRQQNVKRGIPIISDLPYAGALFRKVGAEQEEVELLFLVTPELVVAMDKCQVPPDGPGLNTAAPSDMQLYLKGHIEVPRCPADDMCAPARSPGSAYEYGPRIGGITNPTGGPGPMSEGETIITPSHGGPPPGGQVGPRMPGELPPGSVRSAPPQPAGSPRMADATGGPAARNRAISYSPNNRAPSGVNPNSAMPGPIGPVGYDLKK